ncbi:MAG: stalk domain-containing protein [Firmicutes bacterium]|nr:stalk domain-containing protein [Bacillota bacterium]
MFKGKVKHRVFLFAAVFLILSVIYAFAGEAIKVYVNDVDILFDQQPFNENGRVLVPVRAVFEALDAEVVWDEHTQTIVCNKGMTKIVLTVDSANAKANGRDIELDVPAKIVNGRTFVPVRFVAESIGCFVGWQEQTNTVYITDKKPLRDFEVHYLDVGQADSILIKFPNGQSMLIDAGESSNGPFVVQYIKSQGITLLDYVIGTHPHSDHIGGLTDIINAFDIGMVFMPKVSHTTKTFENLLNAIDKKGLLVHTAKAGIGIIDTNGFCAKFIAPVEQEYANLNNYSAVVKITYLNNVFLFMGDAEKLSENQITEDIGSNVLKVGHHGSDTSTSELFLSRVLPEYAVISVGKANSYGHPSPTVISLLDNFGVKVFRTDSDGTVIITSNGNNMSVSVNNEREED